MTATYPSSRGQFSIESAFPGSPLIAGLARDIADWQNYTYNSDLPISPCDAKVYGAYGDGSAGGDATEWAWQTSDFYVSNRTPQRTAWSTVPIRRITQVLLPPSRIATAGLKIWAWIELEASTSVGTIIVTSTRTGVVYSAAVTYAICGSVLTGAWIGIDAEGQAGDLLTIDATWTSGGSLTVAGLSGYWKPATLWTQGVQSFISQAHVTDDRPAHDQLLRWAAGACNRFAMQRAPLQFLASYYAQWATVPNKTVLGRYKVLVGEKVSSLGVAVFAARAPSVTTTILIKVDGVTKHTFTITNDRSAYAWQSAAFSVTAGSVAAPIDVSIEWGGEASSNLYIPSVSLWEEAASLTLPGSEAIPSGFAPNDNGAMAGGGQITQADWRRLVENMVWIWRYRGLRSLVCDSRYTGGVRDTYTETIGSDQDVQGMWYFRFANGSAGVPRFLSHYHGWTYDVGGDVPDYATSWAWVDEEAEKAAAATHTRVQAAGGSTAMRVLASPPWVQSASGLQAYRAWCHRDGGSVSLTGTRHAGMVIEQMPLNQVAGTRA